LRGPRGGLILARPHAELHKKFNSLVFPGTQGGPLMHVIAAKAVAFKEALQPEFKTYSAQVIANARAMAGVLQDRGYKIVSGGTDNHLFLLNLVDKDITGKDADAALGRSGARPHAPRGLSAVIRGLGQSFPCTFISSASAAHSWAGSRPWRARPATR